MEAKMSNGGWRGVSYEYMCDDSERERERERETRQPQPSVNVEKTRDS